jgi:hypothetical protein
MKIELLPNLFVDEKGNFKKQEALNLCGKIAGVCYDKEGFNNVLSTPEAIEKRINLTLGMGHHSVYDHVSINFNLINIPKIFAMILNNEKQYTTSEKSARYTKIAKTEEFSEITDVEIELYEKWNEKLTKVISEEYGSFYKEGKIKKLAQENARYFISVFMPTTMIYTTTLRQINYVASWMKELLEEKSNYSEGQKKLIEKLKPYITEFIKILEEKGLLDERLLKNEKKRELSLFAKQKRVEYFGDVYSVNYSTSFAALAQAHRHRTLSYEMAILENKKYFVPLVLENNEELKSEWLKDFEKVKDIFPQGELVEVNERGTYEDFVLKCKERLCSAAQLEICNQTSINLGKYKEELEKSSHYLKEDILKYTKGARCTFSDYECLSDCNFAEGKTLKRRI